MHYRSLFVALLVGVICLVLPVATPQGFATHAQAQTVSRIIVEGTQRIEPETVTSYMHISAGDPFDPERIDESLKTLFQTGLFSDVRIFRRGNDLVVTVEENPMINRVNFEGNSEVKDKDLEKETELKERSIFTRSKVQSDVQRILAVYRRSGYYSARVEPKIIRLPQNRVDLVYEINEGVETTVKAINFVGNEAFSDSDLRSVITTAEHAWWKFFSTADRYDPDRLNYDKELLRRYYLKNGFADVKIIAGDAELAPDGENFYITFTIDEGPLYKLGAVTINQGNTNLNAGQLQRAVVSNPGEDYDSSKVDQSVENITLEAGKQGYAFAKVQPDIQRDEPTRTLNIVYNIQEGPRAYIERIEISGNTRTLDEVIRREMRLYEGDAYNRVLVDRARRRLVALDFFEKVDFREEPGSAPDKVILHVDVVEKSTGTLSASAGYSTTEGAVVGGAVTERNLLGKGQYVNLSTDLSFLRQSIAFSFTEPYFLDMPLGAGFDLFATQSDNTDISSYSSSRLGGALRTGFRLDEFQSLGIRYSLARRTVDVDDDNLANVSPAILDAQGTSWKSMLGGSYVYDDLDNPIRPTKGFRGRLGTDVAGLGGDVYYVAAEASGWYFMPLLFDGVVMKLEANAGHMEPLQDEVPIIDRYFKGADSFRGFAVGGVGPQMKSADGSKDAIGAETFGIGTVEVNFPLGLPEEFGLSGAIFSDFGTVFQVPEQTLTEGEGLCIKDRERPKREKCTVYDTASLRASVGAGVIWQSPFGPLRVDLSYPFLKQTSDTEEWFRFSVGTTF
jgi:outer membrane protein insertion porin family